MIEINLLVLVVKKINIIIGVDSFWVYIFFWWVYGLGSDFSVIIFVIRYIWMWFMVIGFNIWCWGFLVNFWEKKVLKINVVWIYFLRMFYCIVKNNF